jgi:membrane fusion protein, peptide pheromone/bacteriocin exporter
MQTDRDPIIPIELAPYTIESLQVARYTPIRWVYGWLLTGLIITLLALPLIEVDVSVSAPGIVRPATERVDLRTSISGTVETVLARENERVAAGQPLLMLQTLGIDERLARNRERLEDRAQVITDLRSLATSVLVPDGSAISPPQPLPQLRTESLAQQHRYLRAQQDATAASLIKAQLELDRHNILGQRGLIPAQTLEHLALEVTRLTAEQRLHREQMLSQWSLRLREEEQMWRDLQSEQHRLEEERERHVLRAPREGILLGFVGLSAGGHILAGHVLGQLSPDDTLLIETFVSPRDVGLIRVGQPVKIQVDAFPYTHWGSLTGVVSAISGDLLTGERREHLFKVTVVPEATTLRLPDGSATEIRKGLTLTARFFVSRRSVFQLLYDKAAYHFDPA